MWMKMEIVSISSEGLEHFIVILGVTTEFTQIDAKIATKELILTNVIVFLQIIHWMMWLKGFLMKYSHLLECNYPKKREFPVHVKHA